MSCFNLTEKEMILHELEELRFTGDIIDIEHEEETERNIIQPLEGYYELLRRLREIERENEELNIFINFNLNKKQ